MKGFDDKNEVKNFKDYTDIRRPFDANIQKMPKKPLTARQKESFVKKYLRNGISAYRKSAEKWRLANDFENPKAPNAYLFGYDPEEIVKNTKKLKKDISTYQSRLAKLHEKEVKKGLTIKETEKQKKYRAVTSELEAELKKETNKWKIAERSNQMGNGDDIGQEGIIFFYRCLARFDVSVYDGVIGDKNYENKGKVKTPKTLDFYFINFLYRSITNLGLDTIKRNVSTGQSVFTHGDSKTSEFSAREVFDNNINVDDEDSGLGFEGVVKLNLIEDAFSSIDSGEKRDFALARIHQKKDVVIKMYGDQFSRLNEWYLSWKHDIKVNFEEEINRYENEKL